MVIDARGVLADDDAMVSARGRRRIRVRAAMVLALVLGTGIAGCGTGSYPNLGPSASRSPAETEGTGDDDVSEAQEVSFDDLIDDPAALVGERIRVTGNVFFIATCPPPGSADTRCVLFGYLTDPERRAFIASDVTQAIALAEGGRRLSCVEGSQPAPVCGDWETAATYTIEGVVERQVLGGRETELVQLDVSDRSEPQHW